MSERNALLAAIRANPDEDTPRLVFADWLDENEPDSKPRSKKAKPSSPSSWAALIRAECEFERLRNDGSAAAAVFAYFVEKDEQTLAAVRWERILPEMCRRVELSQLIPPLQQASTKARSVGRPRSSSSATLIDRTHRGFPSIVNVWSTEKWLPHLKRVMAFSPPVEINFDYQRSPTDIDQLLAAGLSRWCRGLHIPASSEYADLIVTMSHSADVANIQSLCCGWAVANHVGRILTAISGSPKWSGLRELIFHSSFQSSSVTIDTPYTPLPPELPGQFFNAPHIRKLTRLTIHRAERMREIVAALSGLTELRQLSLTHSQLSDEEAIQLANSPGLAKLRYLDLSFNQITGRGASALLSSKHLKGLAVLNFEGNAIRRLDRTLIANAPTGGLRVLNLQSNQLNSTDITTISSSPRVTELMYFAACYNPFPESAIARLVKGFGTHAPAVLYLMSNNITTTGAQTLANWPASTQIDMLHLSGNRLSTPGAKALACSPYLKDVNHLCAGVSHSAGKTALKKQFGERVNV